MSGPKKPQKASAHVSFALESATESVLFLHLVLDPFCRVPLRLGRALVVGGVSLVVPRGRLLLRDYSQPSTAEYQAQNRQRAGRRKYSARHGRRHSARPESEVKSAVGPTERLRYSDDPGQTNKLLSGAALVISARRREPEELVNRQVEPAGDLLQLLKRWCVDAPFDQAQEIDGDSHQFRKLLLRESAMKAKVVKVCPELLSQLTRHFGVVQCTNVS